MVKSLGLTRRVNPPRLLGGLQNCLLTLPKSLGYTLPMALIVKVIKHLVSWDECQESIDLATRNWYASFNINEED